MSDQLDYTEAELEALLPYLWDTASFAWSEQDPRDRGTKLADVRRAWKRAEIPLSARQVLFLRYAMGKTHAEIAEHMVTRTGQVSQWDRLAMELLLASLNNSVYTNEKERTHQ